MSRRYKNSSGNLSKHGCSQEALLLPSSGPLDSHVQRAPDFSKLLVRWLVLTYQPISVVEHEAFKTMIHGISTHLHVPSRREVVAELTSLEATARAGVLNALEGQMVALTEDAWTSAAVQAFLSLTVHYLDENFTPVSLPVECSPFPGSHTAEAIAAKTEAMLERNGIPLDYVSAIVADNAANQVAAGRLAPFDSVACVPHTLQLTAKKLLDQDDVFELLRITRKIVGAVKHSSLKGDELKAEQKVMGLQELRLLQDVKTRWASTYRHLLQLLINKRAVNVLCSRHAAPDGQRTNRARLPLLLRQLPTQPLQPQHCAPQLLYQHLLARQWQPHRPLVLPVSPRPL